MTNLKEYLDEVKAREAKATKGPWCCASGHCAKCDAWHLEGPPDVIPPPPPENQMPTDTTIYPPNWPKCPHCGDPCMDGKATCGNSVCNIAETARRDYEHAMAYQDADESATARRNYHEQG